MIKVLIASPVRQKPAILREFLAGLEGLETEGLEVDFMFVDDHPVDCESSDMLLDFQSCHKGDHFITVHPPGIDEVIPDYTCTETTHMWNHELVNRVAEHKDAMIYCALVDDLGPYDYIFLVDSDIVLHPHTLTHLVSLGKDIVSEVFWTKWAPDNPPLPNVWLSGPYHMHRHTSNEQVPPGELARETNEFLAMLRKPGTYPVGGLGACTLISRKALEAGVSFAPIDNLDYWGEDRHFCVRAKVLGLELWADTHFPPYHIYRESELPGLALWRDRQRERGSRITVGMLVRNEAGRYLNEALEQAKKIADNIVIIDDASDDNTQKIISYTLKLKVVGCHGGTIPPIFDIGSYDGRYWLSTNPTHGFNNEVALRKQLWDQIIKHGDELCTGTDWILILDADELLEPRALEEIRRLAEDPEAEAYTFRLYDMWDADHYRDDTLWNAHRRSWHLMVRYIPGREYVWREQPLHCGRYPVNTFDGLVVRDSGLRIKHMGYATNYDRHEKVVRYHRLDPEGKWGIKAQYDSILDPSPTLRPWVDEEKPPTISLCMIVRNEERNLPRCLESVRGAVDHIVVVDTGSTDGTRSVIDELWLHSSSLRGGTYKEMPWENDFSAARNASLDSAIGMSDWILILDADEELPPASRDMLRPMLASMPEGCEGLLVKITSLMDEGKNSSEVLRIFRNRPEYRFTGAIHEQVMDSIMTVHQGRSCIGTAYAFEILHHGYTEAAMVKKEGRNLEMFEGNPPAEDDLLAHYHHGVELLRAGRHDDAIREFVAATRGIDVRQIYLPRLVRYVIMALVDSGRPDRALGLVRLGIKLWPDYADLYYYGGMIEKGRGNLRAAMEYFRRAVDSPEQPLCYSSFEGVRGWRSMYEAGQVEEALGGLIAAIDWYESALLDHPDFPEVKTALERMETQEPTLAGLDDWSLLGAYMATVIEDGPVDVGTGDGKVFRGVTAEAVGRLIEGRCG